MRRLILFMFVLTDFAICSASYDIVSSSTLFSVVCKVDQSVGFDWKNGQWVQVEFTPQTYIISKLDPLKDDDACLIYRGEKASGDVIYPSASQNIGISNGCYVIKSLGQDASPFGRNCTETWLGSKNKIVLDHVYCKRSFNAESDFEFQINGEIVLTNTYSPFVIKPRPGGNRDSITLELGKCAQI